MRFKLEEDFLVLPICIDSEIKDSFNLELITEVLRNVKFFNDNEDHYLKRPHRQFRENIATLTPAAYIL